MIREPGRIIIREGGRTIIRHDESSRFGANARDVRTERRGSETVTVIERPDGTRIVTVVDENGRLIRRSRRLGDGREVVIIDNHYQGPAGGNYYVDLPPPVIRIPRERYIVEAERASPADIYAALTAPPVDRIERRYTLDEVRYSPRVRERMPRVDLDTVTFETGSWEIAPDQMNRLAPIAQAILQAVQRNPAEVFLIEGHTDAVGSDVDNLSLSDRRAESVAVALTEQFRVPAENLTTQGYGEQYPKVPTEAAERQNRRVTARRITPLLTGQNQAVSDDVDAARPRESGDPVLALDSRVRGNERINPQARAVEHAAHRVGKRVLAIRLVEQRHAGVGRVAVLQELLGIAGREHRPQARAQLARPAQQVLPVDPVRHDQIGEQQVDRERLAQDRERGVAVLGLQHGVAEPAQKADRDAAHRRAVFDHQDAFRCRRAPRPRAPPSPRLAPPRRPRAANRA